MDKLVTLTCYLVNGSKEGQGGCCLSVDFNVTSSHHLRAVETSSYHLRAVETSSYCLWSVVTSSHFLVGDDVITLSDLINVLVFYNTVMAYVGYIFNFFE